MDVSGNVILLVEDGEDEILIFRKAYAKAEVTCRLQIVRDGLQALAYLGGAGAYTNREEYPLPGLIIMDINMPRMSGFEVLRWMRDQPALKHLPTVMFTSSSFAADVKTAYDLAANSYLVKPINAADLVEIIKTLERYWFKMNVGLAI